VPCAGLGPPCAGFEPWFKTIPRRFGVPRAGLVGTYAGLGSPYEGYAAFGLGLDIVTDANTVLNIGEIESGVDPLLGSLERLLIPCSAYPPSGACLLRAARNRLYMCFK
jgi:hypothetical protein